MFEEVVWKKMLYKLVRIYLEILLSKIINIGC